MKLLFDENLSPKLVGLLVIEFPESAHVYDLGLRGAGTAAIAALLREQAARLTQFVGEDESALLIVSMTARTL